MVLNHINKELPEVFENFLQYTAGQHLHNTREANSHKVSIPQTKTTQYGLQSIKYKTAKDWNKMQNKLEFNFNEPYLSKNKFIKAFKEYCFDQESN